ncbi:MAG: lipoprotein-releasing ABC transporter ATP-binding protein LolD [Aureliella sp.]
MADVLDLWSGWVHRSETLGAMDCERLSDSRNWMILVVQPPAVTAKKLCKTYEGATSVRAVADLELVVQPGERLAVVGKSGSGKSTFLNLLAGLDHPTGGELIVGGRPLHDLSQTEMATYRLSTIGVIFQAFQLIPQRSALENVELPLIFSGLSPKQRKEKAADWLGRVGLSHREEHHPYQLSGGEQQRVSIARALVNDPQVVLADEPTGNLDSSTANEIVALIKQLCDADKKTFILVTHDMEVGSRLCSRMLRMQDGRLQETTDAAD